MQALKEEIDMIKVLCYIALLVLPCCSFLVGLKRRSGCAAMNAKLGYSSDLALLNAQTWAYAQKASSLRYMVVSVVLALVCLWFFSILPAETPAALFVSALTVFMFQVVVMVVTVSSVEVGLHGMLHPHARKAKK